jgi:hypothetical protein
MPNLRQSIRSRRSKRCTKSRKRISSRKRMMSGSAKPPKEWLKTKGTHRKSLSAKWELEVWELIKGLFNNNNQVLTLRHIENEIGNDLKIKFPDHNTPLKKMNKILHILEKKGYLKSIVPNKSKTPRKSRKSPTKKKASPKKKSRKSKKSPTKKASPKKKSRKSPESPKVYIIAEPYPMPQPMPMPIFSPRLSQISTSSMRSPFNKSDDYNDLIELPFPEFQDFFPQKKPSAPKKKVVISLFDSPQKPRPSAPKRNTAQKEPSVSLFDSSPKRNTVLLVNDELGGDFTDEGSIDPSDC